MHVYLETEYDCFRSAQYILGDILRITSNWTFETSLQPMLTSDLSALEKYKRF